LIGSAGASLLPRGGTPAGASFLPAAAPPPEPDAWGQQAWWLRCAEADGAGCNRGSSQHQVAAPARRRQGHPRQIRRLMLSWLRPDHPDDPTGAAGTQRDRRHAPPDQPQPNWSRPVRRWAPAYGSGGWGFESLAARAL